MVRDENEADGEGEGKGKGENGIYVMGVCFIGFRGDRRPFPTPPSHMPIAVVHVLFAQLTILSSIRTGTTTTLPVTTVT